MYGSSCNCRAEPIIRITIHYYEFGLLHPVVTCSPEDRCRPVSCDADECNVIFPRDGIYEATLVADYPRLYQLT